MNEIQVKSILEIALNYFNKEQYNNLIKDLIKKCEESEFDLDFPVSRIFYDNLIQLERDRDFLIEMMKSSISRRIVHAFVHYSEENSKSIVEYKDIILALSYTLTEDKVEQLHNYWEIDDELSKLIVGLYDEISQLQDEESKGIIQQCLNIWDLMFEKRIGLARTLSQQILDR